MVHKHWRIKKRGINIRTWNTKYKYIKTTKTRHVSSEAVLDPIIKKRNLCVGDLNVMRSRARSKRNGALWITTSFRCYHRWRSLYFPAPPWTQLNPVVLFFWVWEQGTIYRLFLNINVLFFCYVRAAGFLIAYLITSQIHNYPTFCIHLVCRSYKKANDDHSVIIRLNSQWCHPQLQLSLSCCFILCAHPQPEISSAPGVIVSSPY